MEPAAKKQRVDGQQGQQQQAQKQQHQGQGKRKKPPSPEVLVRGCTRICSRSLSLFALGGGLQTCTGAWPPHPAHCLPVAAPPMSQLLQVRMEIQAAAKENDVATALAVFDRAKKEGIRVSPELYITLLYLCSGGDSWERQLSSAGEDEQQPQPQQQAGAASVAAAEAAAGDGAAAAANGEQQQQRQQQSVAAGENGSAVAAAAPAPAVEQPAPGEVARRASELFAEMEQSRGLMPMNEMCYTAMARLAALQGDADRAFELVQVRSWGTLLLPGVAGGHCICKS